jgi:hypothetical protein
VARDRQRRVDPDRASHVFARALDELGFQPVFERGERVRMAVHPERLLRDVAQEAADVISRGGRAEEIGVQYEHTVVAHEHLVRGEGADRRAPAARD